MVRILTRSFEMLGQSIYTLSDPRTGEIRYVGYTKDVRRRMACHLCVPRDKSYRARWVRKLKSLGLQPNLKVLCVVDSPEEAKRVEIALIARYKQRGFRLTNTTAGGEGLTNPSQEVRDKIKAGQQLHWSKPGEREKARQRTLTIMTPELRAKLSAHTTRNRTGTKHSEQTKKRMSESWTDERRANNPLKGRERDPEVCAKISAAKKGVPRSPETLAKMSATRKARFASGAYENTYPRNESGRFTPLKDK